MGSEENVDLSKATLSEPQEASLANETQADEGQAAAGGGSSEIARLRAEVEEARERHIRLLAEFENFRRRTQKERSELIKYQGEQIITDLLEVIDNFERAMSYVEGDAQQFRGGVELIFRNFHDLLQKWGVRLEAGVGREFDPAYQSALSTLPSTDLAPGTVVGELKKAVFYKDKLIRVGEVVVAGPAKA